MERLLFRISSHPFSILPLLVVVFCSCSINVKNVPKNGYAVENISVIDVETGEILHDQTIIIQDSIIKEIGNSETLSVPDGFTRINERGKFVIPTLWDMHYHISSDEITRNILFPITLANGITGVRIMNGDCYNTESNPCTSLFPSHLDIKKWKQDIRHGRLHGPEMYVGSGIINGSSSEEHSSIFEPFTKKQGRLLVDSILARGSDFIKPYDLLGKQAYLGILERASELGVSVEGHVPLAMKSSEVSQAGQRSIEHCCEGNLFEECSAKEKELRAAIKKAFDNGVYNVRPYVLELIDNFDSVKCDAVLNIFLENETWFTPTLAVYEVDYSFSTNWRNRSEIKYVPNEEIAYWERMGLYLDTLYGQSTVEEQEKLRTAKLNFTRLIYKKGIPLLAGSDCGSVGTFWGFDLHTELALLVEAGLSELSALQTATINPARFLKRSSEIGKIKKNMRANFLVLDKNPLDNIQNTKAISGLSYLGKYYSKADLDALLLGAEKSATYQ